MGIYQVECPRCGQIHVWFSGSSDQRCDDCRAEAKGKPVEKDEKLEQAKESEDIGYV